MTTKQLGSRLEPSLADWIQTNAKAMGLTQGEFVARMQQVYIENDITQKYPGRSVQIKDVHYWAKSLVDAYVAQIERESKADDRARSNMAKTLERKDTLIEQQLADIKELKAENKRLLEAEKQRESLQRDLEAARARIREMEDDIHHRLEDLRIANQSLMGDKIRLEGDIQRYQEQIANMQAAVGAFEAMKEERDAALARIEEEHKTAQEAQERAVTAAKAMMQHQIDDANARTHQAMIAEAAAQAEAASLRAFRDANNELHETIGAQKARISMLEAQLTEQKNRSVTQEESLCAL